MAKKKNVVPTPFGRFARKLRIDRGQLMKDMAQQLGVTTGFLSAVETGRRNVPQGWEGMLADAYKLTPEQVDELDAAMTASRTYDVVNVANLPFEDRRLVRGVAEAMPELSREQRETLERWIENALN